MTDRNCPDGSTAGLRTRSRDVDYLARIEPLLVRHPVVVHRCRLARRGTPSTIERCRGRVAKFHELSDGGRRFELAERDLTWIRIDIQARLQFGEAELVIETPSASR